MKVFKSFLFLTGRICIKNEFRRGRPVRRPGYYEQIRPVYNEKIRAVTIKNLGRHNKKSGGRVGPPLQKSCSNSVLFLKSCEGVERFVEMLTCVLGSVARAQERLIARRCRVKNRVGVNTGIEKFAPQSEGQ